MQESSRNLIFSTIFQGCAHPWIIKLCSAEKSVSIFMLKPIAFDNVSLTYKSFYKKSVMRQIVDLFLVLCN